MIDDGGMWIRRFLWCGLNSGVTSKLFGPLGMAGRVKIKDITLGDEYKASENESIACQKV